MNQVRLKISQPDQQKLANVADLSLQALEKRRSQSMCLIPHRFLFFDWFIFLITFLYQEAWEVVCFLCHFSARINFELRAQEQRKEFTWPKWCDTTINNEKWDGGSAKKPEKGKSPSPAIFDDPEGQPALPESLAAKCKSWKRIPDLFANGGGTCVFEDAPGHGYIFLFQEFYVFLWQKQTCSHLRLPPSIVQTNANLTFSPFIRHLLSSIRTVQEFTHESEGLEEFRPGYLIWSLNKSGKEHKPLVNNNGKYAVKVCLIEEGQ